MMRARATALVARAHVLALVALAACVPPRPTAQSPGERPVDESTAAMPLPVSPPARDDRVILRRTADVLGVAVSRRFAFAVTTGGLVTWDRVTARWLPPLADDGLVFPGELGDVRPTAFAADPLEDAVWLGVPGAVLIVRPLVRQVQRATLVGIPDAIVFQRDQLADAYVRAGGQWQRVTRTGFVEPVAGRVDVGALVRPPTLADVYARYPGLEGQLPLMLRDARDPFGTTRRPVVTSGTLAPDRTSEAWIGTLGDGLWEVDANFLQATPRQFGLLDEGAMALGRGANGVWVGGAGTVRNGGVSFVGSDLRTTEWLRGTVGTSLDGRRATAIAQRGSALWLGTLAGLVRWRLDTRGGVTDWGVLHGLPDDRVLALAAFDGGAWVGTARGLARIVDTVAAAVRGTVEDTPLRGIPVTALATTGDTAWVGTTSGLFATHPRDTSLLRPGAALPELRRPVRALALADTLLYVVTDCAITPLVVRGRRSAAGAASPGAPASAPAGWRAPAGCVSAAGAALADPSGSVRLGGGGWLGGTIRGADVDDRLLVVVAEDRVLLLPLDGDAPRAIEARRDLPGRATSVRLDGEWLWIGTTGGLVRWRRGPDGTIP